MFCSTFSIASANLSQTTLTPEFFALSLKFGSIGSKSSTGPSSASKISRTETWLAGRARAYPPRIPLWLRTRPARLSANISCSRYSSGMPWLSEISLTWTRPCLSRNPNSTIAIKPYHALVETFTTFFPPFTVVKYGNRCGQMRYNVGDGKFFHGWREKKCEATSGN